MSQQYWLTASSSSPAQLALLCRKDIKILLRRLQSQHHANDRIEFSDKISAHDAQRKAELLRVVWIPSVGKLVSRILSVP